MNLSHTYRLSLLALLLTFISFYAQAQGKRDSPPVAREGFWVVETLPKGKPCTVRFYTNDQKLIYQETIHHTIRISRRQTQRQLNMALEQAMFVWNATHQIPTDRQWVAIQFTKK